MHGFESHSHVAFIVMYATHMQENNNITGSCQGCESDARHSVNDANDAHAAFGMTRVIASSLGVPNCRNGEVPEALRWSLSFLDRI